MAALVVEGRKRGPREEVFGQHALKGNAEMHALGSDSQHIGEELLPRFVERQHRRLGVVTFVTKLNCGAVATGCVSGRWSLRAIGRGTADDQKRLRVFREDH